MEAKKDVKIKGEEGKLTRYGSIISIWRRLDETYGTSVNLFLFTTGLFLVGYSQLIEMNKGFLYRYCAAGILICLIWLFVLHRIVAQIYVVEDVGLDLEKEIFSDLNEGGFFTRSRKLVINGDREWIDKTFKRRKIFTKVTSAFIMSYILPILLLVIWIGLMIATYNYL